VIASTVVGALAYMTAALQAAERNNALLKENVRLRQDLREKTDELHEIELGIVRIYRVAIYDLMGRTGLDGMSRPGEHGKNGSVFLTIFNAVDDVADRSGLGGGSDEDERLPEMWGESNAEASVEAPK
jgi:hypothetical protein